MGVTAKGVGTIAGSDGGVRYASEAPGVEAAEGCLDFESMFEMGDFSPPGEVESWEGFDWPLERRR